MTSPSPTAEPSPLPIDATRKAVEEALEDHADRFLDSHGGAVHVKSVVDGHVELIFEGACSACPAVAATFYSKVAPVVRAVPGVRTVATSNVNVSEAAVQRILTISSPRPKRFAS